MDVLDKYKKQYGHRLVSSYSDPALEEPQIAYITNSLYQLFLQQANIQKNRLALKSEAYEISYLGLKREVDQLAAYLQHCSVERGDVVALVLCDPMDIVRAILAVLKAGGAVTLINPETSLIKSTELLQLSRATFVLTENNYWDKLSRYSSAVSSCALPVFIEHAFDSAKLTVLTEERAQPSTVAQVIASYDPHCGACNLSFEHEAFVEVIQKLSQRITVTPHDKLLIATSCYQSRFMVELFFGLTRGLTCYLAPCALLHQAEQLGELIQQNQLTVVIAPSFVWSELVKMIDCKKMMAVCVRDSMSDPSLDDLSHNFSSIVYYHDVIDTVLCSGISGGAVFKGIGETLAYYPKPEMNYKHMLAVLGAPRMTVNEGLVRAGHFLKDYYGDVYAFIDVEPVTVYVQGIKLFIKEVEALLRQHPHVEKAILDQSNAVLSISVYIEPGYILKEGEDEVVVDMNASNAKDSATTSITECKLRQLAGRLTQYLANKLVVPIKPNRYVFKVVKQ